ncbi:hypothetical protein PAF17_17570 [Paracoccus sp. Z330]|uniref:Uncharacterized protein n=1 Tax=Paracoccus onchidii TaxID=3017813 RepID=A0ABT4ZIW0_9RHOB|nr:hypothetical protein [Paracoccus onchidii]MDB6179302.1 hypothetical protein [Paracoccus onchidii]
MTEKTEISDVAQAVRRAVTDEITPMMLPAGADAERWFREEGLPLPGRPAAAGTTR